MIESELLRYGEILSDMKYEINGHFIRNRKILYYADGKMTVWILVMIDGKTYKMERMK